MTTHENSSSRSKPSLVALGVGIALVIIIGALIALRFVSGPKATKLTGKWEVVARTGESTAGRSGSGSDLFGGQIGDEIEFIGSDTAKTADLALGLSLPDATHLKLTGPANAISVFEYSLQPGQVDIEGWWSHVDPPAL